MTEEDLKKDGWFWLADYDGAEVGFPDFAFVAYYTKNHVHRYVDVVSGMILDEWEAPVLGSSHKKI